MSVRKALQIFILSILTMAAVVTTGLANNISEDVIFQVSSVKILFAGGYDGKISFGEIKKFGDFGLGTIDGLDGEMIINSHFLTLNMLISQAQWLDFGILSIWDRLICRDSIFTLSLRTESMVVIC